MGILPIIFYLVVGAVCAFIAERCEPGVIPGGIVTSMIVGVLGAGIGGNLLGHYGPNLAGVALVPCILGSAILVFGLAFCSKGLRRSRA